MNMNQIQTIEAYNEIADKFYDKIGVLSNYNFTYDYLIKHLKENDHILDLACGPAQISKYIKDKINVKITGIDLSREMLNIAAKFIPDGNFIKDSIITYRTNIQFDLIIIGFGISYLDSEQTKQCLENCIAMLKNDGYIYISFMEGNTEGFEKTSFGENREFYMYYHEKDRIKRLLKDNKVEITEECTIDYKEQDGRITKDIILTGAKK